MSSARKPTIKRIRAAVARFRRESLAVRLPYRHRLMYWFSYIRLARKGVMIHSPTEDARYEDGPLKRRYDKYCEKLNERLARVGSPPPVVDVPSFEHGELEIPELRLLMRLNAPFVIRGGAQALRVRDWTLDYLREVAGDCDVPINEATDEPSEDEDRPTKAHHYYRFRTGKLAEVVDSIRSGGNARISTAEDVMHYGGGRLRDDLDIPYWERVSGWEDNRNHWLKARLFAGKVVGAQLMMQPEAAFTLWHAEPGDNFFVLAKGDKTWTLAHPYYTAGLRPRVKTTTNYHGSNIDVRESDEVLRKRGYAGYLNIPKVRVRMGPLDVLRVPNHWWHTVVTEPCGYTIAATIRANGMPNGTGPGYTILRWFDEQYWKMAKAFDEEGRIRDSHIGYPRAPRAEAPTAPVEPGAVGRSESRPS